MIINSFHGTTNINGEDCEVAFDQNILTINGITYDQAHEIVTRLGGAGPSAETIPARETGATARPATRVPVEKAPAPAQEPDQAHAARRIGPPPPRVDDAAIASAAATSTPKPKAEPKPKADEAPAARTRRAAPPPPTDEDVAEIIEDLATIIEDEEDIPHAEAQSVERKPATNGKATNGTNGHAKPAPAATDVDPALAGAKKLKDVLTHLIDQGITDVEDLKARCAELRPSVQVLQRITDLDSRIERTLEVMDLGEEVS